MGRGSQKLAYLLIIALGFVLLCMGAYARFVEKVSWLPEMTIAAGVAIAAPGLLSFLYRKYLLDEVKLELQQPAQQFKDEAIRIVSSAMDEVTAPYRTEIALLEASKQAGLVGVYISRAEAIKAFIPCIENEEHEITIIASSLKGLLTECEQEYEYAREVLKRKVKKIKIRFLLTHPLIADLRAKQENRGMQDIGTEIAASLDLLFNVWEVPKDAVKLYLGTPTCFGIKASNAMLLNTYPYMKEAFASPCIIVKKPGYFYEHFQSSHFNAWSSSIAVLAPVSTEALRKNLEPFSKSAQLFMQQAENGGK